MSDGRPAGRRVSVILNPAAGRALRYPCVLEAIEGLPHVDLHWTRGPGHAARIAAEAMEGGADRVLIGGGDGTVHEVVNGLSATGGGPFRLGLLPLGTGNDLCRSLGLSLDPHDAVASARSGEERPADLVAAEVGGDRALAVNFALGGLAGDIALHVTEERRRLWGALVYLRAAVDSLRSLRSYRTELVLDGERMAPLELMAVVVANGRYLGGGIPVAPEARTDDGLLDVVAVRSCRPARLPALLGRVLTGRHLGHSGVLWSRVRRVEIRPDPLMPFNLDGQPFGAGAASFEVLPGALRLVGAAPA